MIKKFIKYMQAYIALLTNGRKDFFIAIVDIEKRLAENFCSRKQIMQWHGLTGKSIHRQSYCEMTKIYPKLYFVHNYLEYDHYRLLELLLSDYEAVIYRDKGLKDVENMLQCQNYLPDFRLHYFLSNNPAEIMHEMFEQSEKNDTDILNWISSQENKPEWREFLVAYGEKLKTKEFGEQIEQNTVKYAGAARKFTEMYLGEIYSLWMFLCMQ